MKAWHLDDLLTQDQALGTPEARLAEVQTLHIRRLPVAVVAGDGGGGGDPDTCLLGKCYVVER